jgi:hypothetical protein
MKITRDRTRGVVAAAARLFPAGVKSPDAGARALGR